MKRIHKTTFRTQSKYLLVFVLLLCCVSYGFTLRGTAATSSTDTANLWIEPTAGNCTRSATSVTYAAAHAAGNTCSTMQLAVSKASVGGGSVSPDVIRMAEGNYTTSGVGTITTNLSSAGVKIIGDTNGTGVTIPSLSPRGNNIEIQNVSVTGGMDLEDVSPSGVTLRNVNVNGHVTLDGPDNFSWYGGTLGPYAIDHGDWPGRIQIQGIPDTTNNIILDGLDVKPVTRTAAAKSNSDHTEIIRFNQGVNGVIIRNSTFENGSDVNSSTIFFGHAGEGSGSADNVTLENNLFSNPGAAFRVLDFNTQAGSCGTMKWRYNTFLDTIWAGSASNCTSTSGISLIGNLGPKPADCGSATYVDNVFTGGTCNSSDLSTSSLGLGGSDGFHLTAGSAAIDHGGTGANCIATDHDGNARPAGAACDAGAIEYGASPGGGGGDPRHVYSEADLENLRQHYGQTSGMTEANGDLNGDGAVNVYDLGIMLVDYEP